MEPDGNNDDELVSGLSGAFAVDYDYSYALNSTFLPTKALTSIKHSQSFLCSKDKMFWISETEGRVYEAQLDNGNGRIPIVDNVDSPRET